MNYFLGIDLGTSYFKAGLFDESGHLKGLGRQYVHKVTDGTTCELPVASFWKTIGNCLDEAIQMAGIRKNAIKSISYSSQVNSFILLDKNDDPLTPLILWPDRRATGMEPPFGDTNELMKRTGLGIIPDAQFTIAKLNWFRKRQPDVRKKVTGILSISDFLTFSLTGQKACDYSTAAMSGLFDIVAGSWWSEQLENIGIRAEMLPLPQRIGAYVGATTPDSTNLTGLPAGIPFYSGGLDHHMAAIGAGIPSNGYISETTGTVLSCVDYTDGYFPQKGVCVAPGLHDGHFFRMMFDENGAISLEWYQKNHAPEYTIPELLEMAAKVECEGLKARPCVATYPGLSGFVPANNVRYHHGHYVRAILESTAHSLQQMVTALRRNGRIPAIVSSGGGSRSELWVKIKSDTINNSRPLGEGRGGASSSLSRPLGEGRGGVSSFFLPECTELSCMGAAMAGALGIKIFHDYNSLVDVWVQLKDK